MELAKEAAALLVDGKTVGFCSRFPVEGTKPEELIPEEAAKPHRKRIRHMREHFT